MVNEWQIGLNLGIGLDFAFFYIMYLSSQTYKQKRIEIIIQLKNMRRFLGWWGFGNKSIKN